MMHIKISKYLKGYRNTYKVDYCFENGDIIHLFEFDEKEVFNTHEAGSSSFYRSEIRNLLDEFEVFNNVQDKLNIEKKSFERIVMQSIEDFYEHEFKDQFNKTQYRIYLRKRKQNDVMEDMIYYEEEFDETFIDEEHFKKWYINIINHNYNTNFTTYNEAKRYQKTEGWKKSNNKDTSNQYGLTKEENELFKEVLKAGFIKLAKKYHPDKNGDTEKMQLLNSLKEKLKNI